MSRNALQGLLPQAPALLLDMLGDAHSAPQAPIRSEIFGLQRFAQHGRSLGETHRATVLGADTTMFFPQLRENLAVLRLAQRYIGSQAASGHDISPAAEWLLDNFHLVEAQLKAIRDGLPKRYFRALPVLQDPPLAGLPRIYGVAWAFVAHTDAAFDEDLLVHYLVAYQEARELTLGEIWALPTTLRVVLIENLRRLAERVAVHKAAREVANLCSDHLDAHPLADLVALHALLDARGVGTEFLAQMAHRLQGRRVGDGADVQAWLQQALPHLAATQAQQIADQAADNLSVSNAIHALRAIGAADWPGIVERSSTLMGLMLQSPMFSAEHTLTRDQTLHGIEALARSSGQREAAVAQVLLALMQPDGNEATDARTSVAAHWLQGSGRPVLAGRLGLTHDWAWRGRLLVRRLALPAYLGALALGTLGLLVWALSSLGPPAHWPTAWQGLAALLMLLPASEAVVAVVNRMISESVRPRHLSRLALGQGIPPEHRVLVAIPVMLTSTAATRGLVHRLHLHHLANTERCAQFALLSDWPDAATEHSPADSPALDEACRALQALNQRYPVAAGEAPRFILLHRQRQYSIGEQAWIGWERKRGKLELLVAALAAQATADGAAPTGFVDLGELSRLAGPTPYLLTLDSDTELPPGRLRELVAIAAHPQNRPQLDPGGRRVAHGYGILQPRVATPLPANADQTPYHWLFAGQCGIDPYSAASSEVYQDLFGEGSFSGKGLLQVQAVHAVLGQRLPDGQVLSHDLLEGSLARCAVATDVTVIEDAPSHADVAAARLHRWTRGDWQLLPFVLQWRRWPLRAINRWKMFDNLRRSLVAPASLALLLLTLAAPGAAALISPWLALAMVAAAFTAGPLLGAVAGLAPSRDDIALAHFYREAGAGLGRALGGGAWHLAQLLAQALLSGDAITRSLWRMLVSRRQLLQWTTAAATQAAAPQSLQAVLQAHWREPLLAAVLLAGLLAGGTSHPGLAGVLCLLWAAAPWLGWWASRPAPVAAQQALTAAEQARLAGIARDSWRFFERCVSADDRHLPPDNLQTAPQDMLAHRTSPTNIGLYLLSAACARRFGWIGTQDLLQRLEATLGTLDTLERCRGHFLNWYDTQTGAALLPRYVSSVDSGNLSGHLLAVAQALRERAAEPADDHRAIHHGLAASRQRLAPLLAHHPGLLDSLAARPATGSSDGSAPASALARLLLPGLALPTSLTGLEAGRLQTLLLQASDELLLWPARSEPPADSAGPLLPASPAEQLAWLGADHLATLRSAWQDVLAADTAAPGETARRLLAVADRCEQIAWAADFSFLYHPRRRLMHLGLRVAEQALDAGFYDLLASESRLTSLLAIAKADAPVGHWAALGRPFHAVGSTAALRSWSGSMFEYLMPSLVLAEPRGSVLQGACSAAVAEQISFGRLHQLPWGVSESAYAARDDSLAYQYAPQGVPRLALRRTPPEDLVVAPYATALAAQVAPRRAGRNFDTLQALGAWQRYGFIEALDYSPARRSGSAAFTPVCTFMAHHQGMSIVALANVLMDKLAQRWCMANPQIEAVASLLHERAPREVPAHVEVPTGLPLQAALALQNRPPGPLREVMPGVSAVAPTHMLGNGSYSVTLRANGAGQSRRRGVAINRGRDDALRDELGSFLYLRQGTGERPFSITQHPAPDPAAEYTSIFHADRVCFDATWALLRAHTTAWVSPEDDIEFRQIDLYNTGDRDLDIELLSAFEVSLAEPRADEAHPVFSNLFVSAEWRADDQALVFQRRPRLAGEDGLCMAHFLAHSTAPLRSLRVEADRAQWLGRNQGASQPLARLRTPPVAAPPASADAAPAHPLLDTGLDPVCAMAVGLRVPAQGQLRLTFATAASTSPALLAAVIDKYRQASHVQRASLMSATLMGIRLRSLGLSAPNFAAIQSLTTALLMTLSRPGLAAAAPAPAGPGACDRRLLWRFGLSGDRPILLVDAGALQGLALLRTLAQALRLWHWGGIACDLVVVNAEAASYEMALHRELGALRDRHAAETSAAGSDGDAGAPRPPTTALFLLRAEELSPGELSTLRSLARVHLQADGRPLSRHVQAWMAPHEADALQRHGTATTPVPVGLASGAPVALASGEFNARTGDFEFAVSALRRPARPWINVLANPGFGCHVSEAGGGHSWAQNSRLHQLTPWSNDPLADPPGEWLLLQDRRSGALWSLSPSAHADPHTTYQVVHGQGSSRISHSVRHGGGDVRVSVQWCVDRDSAVKQLQVTIINGGSKTLHWRLIGAVEWQLGAGRGDRASVASSLLRQRLGPASTTSGAAPARLTALLATQQEQAAGFGGSTAFFGLVGPADEADETADWTADRREFFDARGRLVVPDHCGQRDGAGLDPMAALCAHLTLPAGAQLERVFLLGHAASADAARQLAISAAAKPPGQRLAEVQQQWQQLLQATTVQTPDPLFDVMVNHWLLYQTVACRLWAKAGFYQAGGATGFRDQLQDTLALAWAAPQLLRAQIVLCASRQFEPGDVQHWWHDPGGAGVRTHFSDDLLWLPWACVHYLQHTADSALLDERLPFLQGAAIPAGAEDAYDTPTVSAETASVYEHAARTIDRSLRVGVHGLPLMGTGDWNDGMNRVGAQGRGESVWLAWMLCRLVDGFAPLAEARGEPARADNWRTAAAGWRAALQGPAWDGEWYRRAFFDDGSPLGADANPEARIDLIAQAWAVLSNAAPAPRQRAAMHAAQQLLVDNDHGLIRLLDPPLQQAQPSAGYIQAYPPGVRENGGQYSHAGVWALMAQAELSRLPAPADADQAAHYHDELPYRWFTYLSPAHRARSLRWGSAYRLEPYAMAGDVYSQPPYQGRGGWSWYTGAAAWLHRAALESIFGLDLQATRLRLRPCLPTAWAQARITLRRSGKAMQFILQRGSVDEIAALRLESGANALAVGDWLDWADLAPDSSFVVALPAAG